jgi:predicted permease
MSLLSRLRGVLRIERLERDLDEELRTHVEMRARDNAAAGMTPEEAQYEARRQFGNMTLMKEDARRVDIVNWMETARQNLPYAARMLRRNPGFTTVAILTLALGIGANVGTFTVVQAVLLNPLPFSHPEQLVRVYDDLRGSNSRDVGMSVPELWDLRDKSGLFEDISVTFPADVNLTGAEHPDRLEFLGTNTNYFTLLGVRAQLGRTYTVADSRPGFTEGVVISDALWRRMFGGDPEVIGKKVRLDSDLYTIIGVLPPGFRHPGNSLGGEVEVFAAAGFSAAPFPAPPQRSIRLLPGAIARLKPGLSVAQAQARLDAFTAQLSREFPVEYPPAANWGIRLVQAQDDLVGKVRTELLVLFGAVGCVLLIACVNLANLLLARSASRQREIAIRQALGAGRARLIGQLLTESVLLATISGTVALITVVLLKGWLLRLAPADMPRLNEVTLSPGVLLFAFGISIVTGVIFGLAPSLQTVRPNRQVTNLREGSRGSGSSKHQMQISRTLVATEIALSLVLLIGAGLLLRSFWHLIEVRPGFDPHHVVTEKIWLPVPNDAAEDNYPTTEKRAAFHQEVLRRIRGLAGVEDAALGTPNSLPMSSAHSQVQFTIESMAADSERAPVAEAAGVSPDYFPLLRTPLLRGRAFTEADDSKGQRVALVNETLARKYWPQGDAVGQHVKFVGVGPRSPNTSWITIVGIVGDIKTDGLDAPTPARIYLPVNQSPSYGIVVYLRTSADPGALGDVVRREVQSVDPSIPVFAVRTMDELVAKYLAQRKFALELLGVFAGVALVLASIGIYGVMAYTFSRRTNEIGIRMAMGAQQSDIFKIAVGEGAQIVAFGLFAGLAGSLALTQFLQTMLFGVKATDPITFAGISGLLAAVAMAACLVPARKATRVDPLVALRHE